MYVLQWIQSAYHINHLSWFGVEQIHYFSNWKRLIFSPIPGKHSDAYTYIVVHVPVELASSNCWNNAKTLIVDVMPAINYPILTTHAHDTRADNLSLFHQYLSREFSCGTVLFFLQLLNNRSAELIAWRLYMKNKPILNCMRHAATINSSTIANTSATFDRVAADFPFRLFNF